MRLSGSYKYLAMLLVLIALAGFYLLQRPVQNEESGNRTVFVHLFEWTWPDIARECETFLGPHGYAAVQISPPQEHVTGAQWWTRYQPVSYRLESRGGTREQFEDMVRRCRAAGVDIYADAVVNHMSRVGEGVGVAGSVYGRYQYPVPYTYDDFHHCGRHGDDGIRNYQDAWEVRNCELVVLADLATGEATVQEKIAAYLNDLLDTGVAGFRIDAAKHMDPEHLAAILGRVEGQPFVFQEVIDRANEPITAEEYLGNGQVTEFMYPIALFEAFTNAELAGLQSLGSATGWAPSEQAVVFIDNHDEQRGHAGSKQALTHKQWETYQLANVFMLAWPYGYPKVMSSYRFSDTDEGPPSTPPVDEYGGCSSEWACEHRALAIAAMVGFRNQVDGQPVTNWTQLSPSAIAFSRGDRGFVAINAGASTVQAQVPTGLAPGRYQDLLGSAEEQRDELLVGDDQTVTVSLPPMSAIATHAGVLQ